MKLNNLLVDIKTFLLCRKETLFQSEFQQYKWKSWKSWSSFLTNKLLPDMFCGDLARGVVQGILSGAYVLETP